MTLIAPSILSADFARLGEELQAVTRAGADLIHIDVMDGHFVPNITLGPPVIKALRSHSTLPFDVHLMIAQPQEFIEDFAAAGAQIISVQAEACTHLHRTLQAIRQAGCRPAVALNPATPLEAITYVLGEVEMILLMTVNPGFGGQQFIPAVLPKIERLRALIDRESLPVKIQTDGGVNEDTIAQVARAGCDIFVAGTAVFGQPDYARAIKGLRQKADEARREPAK
jgi:ribulose-phosphate 3-epimerase